MLAIVTKYHPATNTKPARISARMGQSPKLVYGWDSSLDHAPNHYRVARALADKLADALTLPPGVRNRYRDPIFGAELPGGRSFAFAWLDQNSRACIESACVELTSSHRDTHHRAGQALALTFGVDTSGTTRESAPRPRPLNMTAQARKAPMPTRL